jgi:hypothetical protein
MNSNEEHLKSQNNSLKNEKEMNKREFQERMPFVNFVGRKLE